MQGSQTWQTRKKETETGFASSRRTYSRVWCGCGCVCISINFWVCKSVSQMQKPQFCLANGVQSLPRAAPARRRRQVAICAAPVLCFQLHYRTLWILLSLFRLLRLVNPNKNFSAVWKGPPSSAGPIKKIFVGGLNPSGMYWFHTWRFEPQM